MDAAEQISGRDRRARCRCPTPAATATTLEERVDAAVGTGARRWCSSTGERLLPLRRAASGCARADGVQGRDRRQPRDAGRLRLPPRRSRPTRRAERAVDGRRARRSGSLMTIVLCRVDDRLIHGQVVVGWGQPLGVERIVLVDDEVAASDWEQDLYRMAVPPEHRGRVSPPWRRRRRGCATGSADVRRTAGAHGRPRDHGRALPTPHPATVHQINLGGIHHRPGRRERLPYVYLSRRGASRCWQGSRPSGAEISAPGPADRDARARCRRSHDVSLARLERCCCWSSGAPGRPRPGERAAGDVSRGPSSRAPWRAGSPGDVEAGLRVGVLLELFALDVLPVGAVRYPDYGPATVAAVALAAGAPWQFALGRQCGARTDPRGARRVEPAAVRRAQCAGASSAAPPRSPRARAGAIRRLQYGGAGARCRPGRRTDRAGARRRVGAARRRSPPWTAPPRLGAHRWSRVGCALVGGGRRRDPERRTRRPASLAGWRARLVGLARWRRCDERRMARVAAAVRGAGRPGTTSGCWASAWATPPSRCSTISRRVDPVRHTEAVVRSAEFFNCNPNLAGLALGAIARAEYDGVPGAQIARLRTALCSPLGALGDQLFWAGLVPRARRGSRSWPWCSGARLVGRSLGFLLLYNVARVGHRRVVAPHRTAMPAWASAVRSRSPGSPRAIERVGPVAGFAVGRRHPAGRRLVPARRSAGAGALGALAVAAAGVAVTRWFGAALTAVRFALLALVLLVLLPRGCCRDRATRRPS